MDAVTDRSSGDALGLACGRKTTCATPYRAALPGSQSLWQLRVGHLGAIESALRQQCTRANSVRPHCCAATATLFDYLPPKSRPAGASGPSAARQLAGGQQARRRRAPALRAAGVPLGARRAVAVAAGGAAAAGPHRTRPAAVLGGGGWDGLQDAVLG